MPRCGSFFWILCTCNPAVQISSLAPFFTPAIWMKYNSQYLNFALGIVSPDSDKHAIPRQAKDNTQTGYYAHCTGIVHKLNDRATSQGHNTDRILCLACGYMTRLRLTALESHINQTKFTASNACTRAESTFFSASSALSHEKCPDKLSGPSIVERTSAKKVRKMSDVRPLFYALHMYPGCLM